MIVDIYNVKNKKVGEIDLPDFAFSADWNPELVHFAYEVQRSNSRKVVASIKNRGEVRGGGKKPWKQKGTGRARHGSIRSPLWKGGGVTHGPNPAINFNKKINKKQKVAALFSLLSKKMKDGNLKIIDSLKLNSPKTKEAASVVKNLFSDKNKISAAFVPTKENKDFNRAAKNIPKIFSLNPESLNVYDLSVYRDIFIEKDAIPAIINHFGKSTITADIKSE
ncbi:MAG: 50S ribosomal protein L4 [Candidatus Pacebacteria bacterium]|nr:50S ribosomal protein L4 [Candidatus Paceibacterota bacterium]